MLRLPSTCGNPDFGIGGPARASVRATTRSHPASLRAEAQEDRVAPVVCTSSTRSTRAGAGPTARTRGGSASLACRCRPTWRGPWARRRTGRVWKAAERRETEGDLLGGIESAPAPAPRRRRHRDHGRPQLLGGTGAKDRFSRHPRKRQPTAELEAVGELPRDPVEPRGGHRQHHAARTALDQRGGPGPALPGSARRGPPSAHRTLRSSHSEAAPPPPPAAGRESRSPPQPVAAAITDGAREVTSQPSGRSTLVPLRPPTTTAPSPSLARGRITASRIMAPGPTLEPSPITTGP